MNQTLTLAGKSAFLELARMTNNRRLRKVYAKAYARHVIKTKNHAGQSAV